MKFLFFALSLTVSSTVFAVEKYVPQCHNQAVKAAVETNFKNFGAGTSSCGLKALHLGEQLETYIACTSDETDPMEYIVVMKKLDSDANGKVIGECLPELVEVVTDSDTPNFESQAGLLKTVECSIDSSGESAVCK